MILRDNPVLTREMLDPVAALVHLATDVCRALEPWSTSLAGGRGRRASGQPAWRRLFDIFFLGQFFLVALMALTFAAGASRGRRSQTYESLLASPLLPNTILVKSRC
jgi:hypothetical protein